MRICHEIWLAELNTRLNLSELNLENAVLKSTPFHCLHWRQFGKLCQLYASGKVILHCSRDEAQQYLNLLCGFEDEFGQLIYVKHFRLSTMTATHDLGEKIDYYKLCRRD